MRTFIAGAAVVAVIVVLVGAGARDQEGLPTLEDLPLAHAWRFDITVEQGRPWFVTMPADKGFVITLAEFKETVNASWDVDLNGLRISRYSNNRGYWTEGHNYALPVKNPPRIVPPGGTMKIAYQVVGQPAPTKSTGELGGYFISKADLGLP